MRTTEFDLHLVIEIAPVVKLGQRIGRGLMLELVESAGHGQAQQHHFQEGANLEGILGKEVMRQKAERLRHVNKNANQ